MSCCFSPSPRGCWDTLNTNTNTNAKKKTQVMSAATPCTTAWEEVGLSNLRPSLDEQALAIAENQESSLESRRALAGQAKSFRLSVEAEIGAESDMRAASGALVRFSPLPLRLGAHHSPMPRDRSIPSCCSSCLDMPPETFEPPAGGGVQGHPFLHCCPPFLPARSRFEQPVASF